MAKLSERSLAVLSAVRESAFSGQSPTVREICEKTGIPSPSSVWKELTFLENEGLVRLNRGSARGITLASRDGTKAAAVRVIKALDPITGRTDPENGEEFVPFSLPERVFNKSYALKVTADCADIRVGDIVVFYRADTVENNSVAVFSYNGLLTLGRVEHTHQQNYAYIGGRKIILGADADIAVVGRILGTVRRFF